MNNWFLILTSGSNTWAPLEGTLASPSAGSVRLVGQAPTIGRSEGEIDGGGSIAEFVESNLVTFYDVLGYVTSDFTAFYSVLAPAEPAAGSLRVVGQQPTLSFAWFRSPQRGTLVLSGNAPTVTGQVDVEVSPATGSLRLVGQVPYLLPTYAYPETGILRLSGQVPEISRIVAPSAGTLRFEGWGTVYREITVTYTLFDAYVTSDLLVRWQRAGSVTSDFTASYQVYGRVVGIRVSGEQNRILVDAPTLPTIRAMPVQKRIYAQRAA